VSNPSLYINGGNGVSNVAGLSTAEMELPQRHQDSGFALTVNRHFIFVTSPGLQTFVSARSVGP
jgi:hypothetical protein